MRIALSVIICVYLLQTHLNKCLWTDLNWHLSADWNQGLATKHHYKICEETFILKGKMLVHPLNWFLPGFHTVFFPPIKTCRKENLNDKTVKSLRQWQRTHYPYCFLVSVKGNNSCEATADHGRSFFLDALNRLHACLVFCVGSESVVITVPEQIRLTTCPL